MSLKRVVVTGLGAVTPIGNDIRSYWEGLVSGKSGADFITYFDTSKFKTQFACELKGFDALNYFDRKEARKMDRFAQYAIVCSDEAIKDYLRYLNLTKGTEREAPAHYGLGWLYHHQGIYHWAAQSFERAIIGDDPQSRKALYYEAVNHKLSGNFQRAMNTFKEFGNRYKEGMWVEQAYYEWGISAFEAGNYDEAITILLNLIRQQDSLSNGAQVYTLLGEEFLRENFSTINLSLICNSGSIEQEGI